MNHMNAAAAEAMDDRLPGRQTHRRRHHSASSICLPCPSVRIREYRKNTDTLQVQQLERSSPSPPPSPPPPGSSLFLLPTSPLGDPLSRVCTYPLFCMMVAEVLQSPHSEADDGDGASKFAIVGVVRAGLKQVATRHRTHDRRRKDCVSLAYISGLRVAQDYRRFGIAQKLMSEVEEWCRRQGAEYCYLATQKENEASVNLFTLKLGYAKFRTPLILVQPITHSNKARRAIHYMVAAAGSGDTIRIVKLAPEEAEVLYREESGAKEFFPKDIDRILQSPLNAGTWAAFYNTRAGCTKMEATARPDGAGRRHGVAETVRNGGGGKGWAMLSLWRYDKLIRFETTTRARWSWAVALKRLGKRVVPGGRGAEGFGVQLVYGVHAAGENWKEPLERLWRAAGEMAAAEGCRALAAELAGGDPLLAGLPHTSCHHDLWYAKRLSGTDLPPATAGASFFLDPRDF